MQSVYICYSQPPLPQLPRLSQAQDPSLSLYVIFPPALGKEDIFSHQWQSISVFILGDIDAVNPQHPAAQASFKCQMRRLMSRFVNQPSWFKHILSCWMNVMTGILTDQNNLVLICPCQQHSEWLVLQSHEIYFYLRKKTLWRQKNIIFICLTVAVLLNPLATDFIIVWIIATIILYINCNFLQNSTFHIARSLHYIRFPSRSSFLNHNLPDCVLLLFSC